MAGRNQFEAMVQASRQTPPPVAGIIVRDLGRLSRDDLESQFYKADLRLRGYGIVSVFDNIPQGSSPPSSEASSGGKTPGSCATSRRTTTAAWMPRWAPAT